MGDALKRLQRVQRRVDALRRLAPAQASGQASPTESAWANDPVAFSRDVFGIELDLPGYSRQADLCRAVAEHPRVACRSGHKTGKTLSIALLAWWFSMTRDGSRTVCTHPTSRQVKETIWREIRRLRSLAARKGRDMPVVPLDPSTGISFENGSQILGFTVDDPDAFSGISAPAVLYLVDEASGVKDAVFEAISGNMAGGGKLVETGNPTTTSGHFFDSFHDKRHLFAPGALLHISSLESPNVITGTTVIPGLAGAEWAATMLEEYGGPGEPIYDVRVLGDFPKSGPNVVIPLHAVELATERWGDEREPSGVLCLGVDVARFGDDDSVIAGVRGDSGGIYQRIHGASVPAVAGAVVDAVRVLRYAHELVRVAIDEGGLGAGVVDLVTDALGDDDAITVIGINAAESARDSEKFDRIRDELWWNTREWLVSGAALEPNHELERELVAPIYSMTPAGKIKVEPQDAIKKRLRRSPDHANALGLAIAASGAMPPASTVTLPTLTSRWEGMGGRGF